MKLEYIKNFEDFEEKYYTEKFNSQIAMEIMREYREGIKETNCLGRYISPCFAKIRIPKWDEKVNPGYHNPRKGFCTIEVGVGPEYEVAFYGFKSEAEYAKWTEIAEKLGLMDEDQQHENI